MSLNRYKDNDGTQEINSLLFFQITALASFAQRIVDSIPVCNLPVRTGVIYRYDRNSFGGCLREEEVGVSILTKDDSVFHFEEGKIAAVNNYGTKEDAAYVVVVMNEEKEFFAYGNLRFVSMKKGDIVKKNAWLGLTGISDNGNERQVDFIYFKKRQQIPSKETAEYVRCNISCVQSGRYTVYATPSSANSVLGKTS
ncbi:MAG: hypothetical protein ACHQFX_20960, partial [Chitinophagales bacterium]